MADNVAITAGTGPSIGTDDVGGIQYQRIKTGFGVDGVYVDVSADAGLPTGPGYTTLSGTASALNADLIASTDVRGYRSFSYQTTGTYNATVTLQGSNDNVTWLALSAFNSGALTFQSSAGSTGQFGWGAVNFRYLRIRATAYTSGTAGITVELSTLPYQSHAVLVYPGNSFSVTASSQTTITPSSDAATTATMGSAAGVNYNGTNWDRQRGATAANATTGTGLLGAGMLGWDGTNYRRIRTGLATSAVTSVAASVTSVTLLALNTAREQATIANESASATLYAKLGATASLTSYTVAIPPGGYYEVPCSKGIWTGVIDGIWSAAVGNARITELT